MATAVTTDYIDHVMPCGFMFGLKVEWLAGNAVAVWLLGVVLLMVY